MSAVGPINRLANRLATPSGRLSLAGLVLVAATMLAASLAIWDRREAVFGSYRREMANLGIALTEQAERSLQAVDLVLRESQREVLATGITDPIELRRAMASEEIHKFLSRHSKNLPQAHTIGVVAVDGDLAASSRSWPMPPVNLADRDWFMYLRDHQAAKVYVSQPVIGRLSGAWTFYLARRLSGPQGEFLGAVVAGVEARYFEEFYHAISLQPGGSIALLERDGTMIARYPRAEAMMGKKLPSRSGLYDRIAEGGGTYRSPGYVDGIARLVSVHPMRDYPLIVTVTIGEEAALTEWRRQSFFVALGAVCLALSLMLLFGMLAARSRRLELHSAELAASAAALTRSEARFRDFAVTSSDWFWETDENHLITYVSEGTRAFGQDPDSRIGRNRIELAASFDRDADKWEEHIAVLNRHEPFRNFVFTAKFGDQPEHTVAVSGKPFFDDTGKFLGYRGTGRDITAEHLAQNRLQEAKTAAEAANLAKSQFLANVSHELRTPLNAIIGFAEVLELGMAGPLAPRQSEDIRIIRQSGEHLHCVINDILDLAKIDAGKLELHEEHGVEPSGIVEACTALVKERAAEAQLILSVDIAPGLPALVADTLRLKQILLNLLSNAIKFTGAGGAVTVAARRTGDGGMVFEVHDTGPGMTPDEIAIALEPFGQVDGGLGRRHDGTGLGLPIASRLAELHGGSLRIYSEKGSGTTVVVTLPTAKVMDQGCAAPAVEAAA